MLGIMRFIPYTSTPPEGKLVSRHMPLPKKDLYSKGGNFVARRLSILGFSGKPINTLSIAVTVINVDSPESNKSQQVATIGSHSFGGVRLNWLTEVKRIPLNNKPGVI